MKTNISEYVKKIRLGSGKTQTQFGSLVWPEDDLVNVRNRVAKYEIGQAIPPGDVIFKIQEIEKSTT